MRIARSFVIWGVAVGLMVRVGSGVGAGESTNVSPVLNRIMAKKELTLAQRQYAPAE